MKKKKEKKKIIIRVISILLPFLLIGIWELGCRLGYLNTSILPYPSKILDTFVGRLMEGTLEKHIWDSFKRVIEGFAMGAGLGLILGVLIGLYKNLEDILNVFIGILRPIPPIAWIPVLILGFGIGEWSKIAVIAIGSFWPVLLNTVDGLKATNKDLVELATVLEKNKKQILLKIILPAAIPSIFTGFRLGVSRAWSCVVTAEMIAASSGVGYLIQYARELSKPDLMFTGVAVIGIIGLVIDYAMMKLQKRVIYW